MSDNLDLDDIGLDPSASETLDVASTTAVAQPAEGDATRADPSSAQGDKDEFDPLSIVRNVVDQRKDPAAASPAEGELGATTEGAKPPKLDDENYTDVPFHKHPRFQQVLRQKKAFEADAGRYQNVQNYIDQQGLTANEAADGLMIMGLAKTDPKECWKLLRPFAEKVLYAAGEALPQDLQQAVDKREISPELALQYSRERAGRQALEGRGVLERQRREADQQRETATSLRSAAEDWERDRTVKDPKFPEKLDAIMKEVHWLHRNEGLPTTPEGVKDQLKRAYDAVNAALPRTTVANGVKPVKPVGGGQVSGNARPEAKSTLDIIRAHRA